MGDVAFLADGFAPRVPLFAVNATTTDVALGGRPRLPGWAAVFLIGVDLVLVLVDLAGVAVAEAVTLAGLPLFVGEVVLLAVPADSPFAGRPRFFAEDRSALFAIAASIDGRPLFFEGVPTFCITSLLASSWTDNSLAGRPRFLDGVSTASLVALSLTGTDASLAAGRPLFLAEDVSTFCGALSVVVVVVVAFLVRLACGCDAVISTTADDLLGIFETLRLSSTEVNSLN